jgi:Xaa-Pro aminopeptidase
MQNRVSNLQEVMNRKAIDCVIATSVHTSFYYTGFWFGYPYGRYAATIIPKTSEPILITPNMESRRAKESSWLQDVRAYSDEQSTTVQLMSKTKEVLSEVSLSGGKIGVEEDVIPYGLYKALQETLPMASFEDISTEMMKQRLVKSQEEIALIRKGAEICKVAVRAGEQTIAEGVTEIDVSMAVELAAAKEHTKVFPDIEFAGGQARCKSGKRSLHGHTTSSSKKLVKGEVIQFGTNHLTLGYLHTLARQRTIGPVPEEIKKRFNVRLEAALTAIDAIKPGVLCSEIDQIAYRVFEKAGYVEFKGFGTGHSFGLFGPFWGREELGELRIYNHTAIQEGMILSMEPSLYVPGVGGLNTVDMILVTKDGHEVLTEYPRELTSV